MVWNAKILNTLNAGGAEYKITPRVTNRRAIHITAKELENNLRRTEWMSKLQLHFNLLRAFLVGRKMKSQQIVPTSSS